jgi:hypothetical protein
MIRDVHLGSQIRILPFRIRIPKPRDQKSTRSRIRLRNTAYTERKHHNLDCCGNNLSRVRQSAGEFCEENVCRPGCHSDSNCPFGQICGDGDCRDGCNFNNDCPINQVTLCLCTVLFIFHSDSNCPFGQICGNGDCREGCNFNNDCPINQVTLCLCTVSLSSTRTATVHSARSAGTETAGMGAISTTTVPLIR